MISKKNKIVEQELDDADGSKKFSREPGRVSNKFCASGLYL